MTDKLPLLSITIPTANRPKCVARLLKRLESEISSSGIDARAVEICVFNNGNHPDTASLIAATRSQIPCFQTAFSENLLPVGDSFASAIHLATGNYLWVLGDDDLPLRNSLTALLREVAEADRHGYPMLQLQQYGCVEIDTAVEELEAACEPEIISPGTNLLTPHAFHWLGQMSGSILHRRFFQPGSLFAARRTDEIIPLLRAVVDGLRAGSVLCLKGRLFARTVDAGNWQGMMAFAHAIEFPRYWNYLKEGREELVRPFEKGFLAKMIVRAAILQDHAPTLYRSLLEVPPVGRMHSFIRLFVRCLQPQALRTLLVRRVIANDPKKAASLGRLREWETSL